MKKKNYVVSSLAEVEDAKSIQDKAFDRFAETMIKKIEEIQKDWHNPWFSTAGMMPESFEGRKYNGMNIFNLLIETEYNEWKAPIFGTFNKFVSLNYDKDQKPLKDKNGNTLPRVSVNKGEVSVPVFTWSFSVVHSDTKARITYDNYLKLSADEKRDYNVYPHLLVKSVFNIDQMNLKEARPDLYKKLVEKNEEKLSSGNGYHELRLDKMIKDSLWLCPIQLKKQSSAYYTPSKDTITLPLYEQFENGQSFYSTMLHEMAHSTGAENRLNREIKNGFASDKYAREELVAEMTSALVCNAIGIRNGVKEESAAYLKSWLKGLKESPDFIKTTLFDVKKAYDMILAEVDAIEIKKSVKRATRKSA